MGSNSKVLDRDIRVINIGIERFSEDLKEAGVPVIQMDWRPPAGGDRKLIELLDSLREEPESDSSE
jgi:FdrA protein